MLLTLTCVHQGCRWCSCYQLLTPSSLSCRAMHMGDCRYSVAATALPPKGAPGAHASHVFPCVPMRAMPPALMHRAFVRHVLLPSNVVCSLRLPPDTMAVV